MGLEDQVQAELLAARKMPDGLTTTAMGSFEVLRTVLGGGDPAAAYNALKHSALALEGGLAVLAACYSLGLASYGHTHLDRLTEFGADYGYDQRQARRYSDRGIREIARFVSTQWTLEASPKLRLSLFHNNNELELAISTERFEFIEMDPPRVQIISHEGGRDSLNLKWNCREVGILRTGFAHYGQAINPDFTPVAISILWRGELWPHFETSVDAPSATAFRFTRYFGSRVELLTSRH